MAFCIYCLEEIAERIEKIETTKKIKGDDVAFIESVAYCPVCGNEISVPEVSDANLDALYDAYRKQQKLISYEEVLGVISKYDISKRNFSLVLGWGDHTIERFCEGYIPTRQYSDELMRLKDSDYFLEVLEKYKTLIPNPAYVKAKKALGKIKNEYKTPIVVKTMNGLSCETDFKYFGFAA